MWFIESWWNSLRFYLKKNKTVSVSIKGKSCNRPEGCNFIKKRFQLRYKDLSMSLNQKVMTLLPLIETCPMDFYQVVFTAQIW